MGIELVKTSSPYGDSTCMYDVIFKSEMTLQEFVNEVLDNKSEWGIITVKDTNFTTIIRIKYKYGVIENNEEIHLKMEDYHILSATANGGWSLMDYRVVLK